MNDKRYYEKFALYSLESLFKEEFVHFVCAESPDLQDDFDNIGIEVTRGISDYEGRFKRLCNECTERNLSLKARFKQANRMFRKNFLGVFHESNGWVITDPSYGKRKEKFHVETILEKIEIKSDKLERIYKKFNVNGLYIFAEFPLNLLDIVLIASKISKRPLSFDYYFINVPGKLYFINANDGCTVRKIDFSPGAWQKLVEKAKQI